MGIGIGVVLVVGGLSLLAAARWEHQFVPRNLQRLGAGIAALGVSTLTMTRPGIAWQISSSCFSLIAIVLIGSVALENLRRPR